jgi:hypothetical protein
MAAAVERAAVGEQRRGALEGTNSLVLEAASSRSRYQKKKRDYKFSDATALMQIISKLIPMLRKT